MWEGASPSHIGSVVFIHCVADAGSVWEGACPRWRCDSPLICNCSSAIGSKLAIAVFQSMHRWLIRRYRGQAPSHIGSVVFIHCVADAGSVWEGACPRWRCDSPHSCNCSSAIGSKLAIAVFQSMHRSLIRRYPGQAPSHMGSVVLIRCVADAGSVWEGACPRWRCDSPLICNCSSAIGNKLAIEVFQSMHR